MPSLAFLTAQAGGHAWIYLPVAILLGALHGLEPGHSKTMMAAFIIAIRGTVGQAVLLGVSAAVSHTAVVWLVALGGQVFLRGVSPAGVEPYVQLASAVLVLAIAAWMLWRVRADGAGRVSLGHSHAHSYKLAFTEPAHHHHHHDHNHHREHEHTASVAARFAAPTAGMDAHERAHADALHRRFTGRDVRTSQIVAFGLTGGLIPCPAAITVLLLCLQLKRLALAVALVLCFSVGVAATMVAAGVVAALGVRHVRTRWPGFDALARRAPYASGALMMAVALYMGVSGWVGIIHA